MNEILEGIIMLVALLPKHRRMQAADTGQRVAELIITSGLTINEQKLALAVAELHLRSAYENDGYKKANAALESVINRQTPPNP